MTKNEIESKAAVQGSSRKNLWILGSSWMSKKSNTAERARKLKATAILKIKLTPAVKKWIKGKNGLYIPPEEITSIWTKSELNDSAKTLNHLFLVKGELAKTVRLTKTKSMTSKTAMICCFLWEGICRKMVAKLKPELKSKLIISHKSISVA